MRHRAGYGSESRLASRKPEINKDETPAPRFTGTLMTYDPAPAFMLHWDKAR